MRTPYGVMFVESLRKTPYSRMLGYAEDERGIRPIVEWLASNGESWDTQVPENMIDCNEWREVYFDAYRCLTKNAVSSIVRAGDGQDFRDDVLDDVMEYIQLDCPPLVDSAFGAVPCSCGKHKLKGK